MSHAVSAPPPRLRSRWWELPLTLAAISPLLIAFVRGVGSYMPTGDDALIALRSLDLWHGHPPLMGQRSNTGFGNLPLASHHPGPLEFYLLAIPLLLTGFANAGLLIGTLLIAGGSAWLTIAITRRHLGPVPGFFAASGVLLLIMQFGPSTILAPYNLTSPALPMLAFVTCCWALVNHRTQWMPAAALTGSYAAQTHLGYLPLVVLITVGLIGYGMVVWRRDRLLLSDLHDPHRPLWRQPVAQTVAVSFIVWLPVLIETVTYHPSNLYQLVRYITADGSSKRGVVEGLEVASQHLGRLRTAPFFQQVSWDTVGVLMLLLAIAAAAHAASTAERRRKTRSTAVFVTLGIEFAGALVMGTLRKDQPAFYLQLYIPCAYALLIATFAYWFATVRPFFAARTARLRTLPSFVAPVIALVTLVGAGAGLGAWRYPSELEASPMLRTFIDDAARVAETRAHGRVVDIRTSGSQGFVLLAPTLSYRLESDGLRTTFPVIFPFRQDDSFRAVDNSTPTTGLVIQLREQEAGRWLSGVPANSSKVATFAIAGGLGFKDAVVEAWVSHS